MHPRTTTSGRTANGSGDAPRARRRPSVVRRPGLCLGVAASGAVLVSVLVGAGPGAQAETGTAESVSVAQQLGLAARSGPAAGATREDLRPLQDLTASRSTRQAEESAASQTQSAADQAALDRQKAEAAASAAAQSAAAASASAAAGGTAAPAAAAGTAVSETAHITNSAGNVRPQTQAAANAVVSNVPGADAITLGGTRASATDPAGHPSGLALDYMVLSDTALGNAIVQYHIAHWDELGVEYVIYRQRILMSPTGAWQAMEDRGSPTENHMDHVHVNYRP